LGTSAEWRRDRQIPRYLEAVLVEHPKSHAESPVLERKNCSSILLCLMFEGLQIKLKTG
jgi:hypothetical protein